MCRSAWRAHRHRLHRLQANCSSSKGMGNRGHRAHPTPYTGGLLWHRPKCMYLYACVSVCVSVFVSVFVSLSLYLSVCSFDWLVCTRLYQHQLMLFFVAIYFCTRHWSEYVVEEGLGEFPLGWEQRFTATGVVYYVDHINRTTTVRVLACVCACLHVLFCCTSMCCALCELPAWSTLSHLSPLAIPAAAVCRWHVRAV